MKHIQVIDGARNCTYSIFAVSAKDFEFLFQGDEDVAFIDEVVARLGTVVTNGILSRAWTRPVLKRAVHGIHGTLFFELDTKKKYYPTRRESEVDPSSINAAQRALFKKDRRRSEQRKSPTRSRPKQG